MDYKYIEQLLRRYFEADTTLKEEQILKTFFAQDDRDLPSCLLPYKSLFSALEATDTLGSDFDVRILAMTGHADTAPSHTPQAAEARRISIAERLRPLVRAAAAVAIVVTLSTAINESFRDSDAWTDEEQLARYQDEMRKAAIAAATADSTTLYTIGSGDTRQLHTESQTAETPVKDTTDDTLAAEAVHGPAIHTE